METNNYYIYIYIFLRTFKLILRNDEVASRSRFALALARWLARRLGTSIRVTGLGSVGEATGWDIPVEDKRTSKRTSYDHPTE